MTTLDIIQKNYSDYYERVLPTGSRVICPEAKTSESDEDFLLLVSPKKYQELETRLSNDGYILGGSLPNQDPVLLETHVFKDDRLDMSRVFHSFKASILLKEEHYRTVNLLLTCNKEYFEDFTRATYLAKALGLTNKRDRVILFKALCEDNWDFPEPEKYMPRKFKYFKTVFDPPITPVLGQTITQSLVYSDGEAPIDYTGHEIIPVELDDGEATEAPVPTAV